MAIGTEFKSSGITDKTPKTVMLGAGTIHKLGADIRAKQKQLELQLDIDQSMPSVF